MSEPTLQDCINYMRSQIKQMEKYPRNYEFNLPYYRKAVELLEKVQRPHEKWITTSNPNHSPFDNTSEFICICSKCTYSSGDRITAYWNFCPNCGADMRTQNDRSWDTSERGASGSVENSISQKEGDENG